MSKNKLNEAVTLRPSDARQAVLAAMDANLSCFIWGPPGIGKSDVVRQIAASGDVGKACVIDMRLALMEPTDLRGFPMLSPAKTGTDEKGQPVVLQESQMIWATPRELPNAEFAAQYDTVILFLDEMNSAPPSVQAAAYQLVLDRKIGEYTLPSNARIIAAGNRDTDKGVTYRMPTPLLNRFLHINMDVNFEDWQRWAINNGIHPDVVGYLSVSPSKLSDFDPKSVSQGFATPRSWTYVSRLISSKSWPTSGKGTQRLQTAMVAGSVGDGVAMEFLEHRRVAGKMPRPADILSGKVAKLDPALRNEISAKFSLTVNLTYTMNEMVGDSRAVDEKTREPFNNMIRFAFDNFQPEMVILLLQTLLRDYQMEVNIYKVLDTDLRKTMEDNYLSLVID